MQTMLQDIRNVQTSLFVGKYLGFTEIQSNIGELGIREGRNYLLLVKVLHKKTKKAGQLKGESKS